MFDMMIDIGPKFYAVPSEHTYLTLKRPHVDKDTYIKW